MVERNGKDKDRRASIHMYQRVGTGRQAELADIRDIKKPTGEETKEDIIREAVDEYPKSEDIIQKVSRLSSIHRIDFLTIATKLYEPHQNKT